MYPHHKLDWHISRLESRLTANPDDNTSRLDYAEHCLSRARFHDGGEPWYNRALTQARRVLSSDPNSVGALVIAGLSLVGLQRLEPATRYLDQALKEDHNRADVHFALGCLYRVQSDRHQALREFEISCRLAPESFETHHSLALVLWARARELGTPRRLVERSQFHTTRALELGPTLSIAADLRFHLAMTALHTGRWTQAHRLLTLLVETERFKDKSRYFLGISSYHLGKHKNAILYLRQHLEVSPNDPRVYARIGMSYLQLGEASKARTACNRALAVDPSNIDAQWTLGCALLEEGQIDDASGVFRDLLADHPEHIPAFTELVRIRQTKNEKNWLRRALRSEVSGFDRLPVHAVFEGPEGDRSVTPRAATRNRIAILLKSIGESDPQATKHILDTIPLTTDESLRFLLWEAILQFTSIEVAKRVCAHLERPGTEFELSIAQEALAVTALIPEDLLTQGLQVTEEDLNRAAVDRHGPARDLRSHRGFIEEERRAARAWQALLLLAVGDRRGDVGRTLLIRWAAEADPDLAMAARTALALHGDPDTIALLRNESRRYRAEAHVDALVDGIHPITSTTKPTLLSESARAHCATCGRSRAEVGHLMQGSGPAICNQCMGDIATRRRELRVEDPSQPCALCQQTNTQTAAVYRHQSICICSDCLDRSLGMVEREAVDRYFVSLGAG